MPCFAVLCTIVHQWKKKQRGVSIQWKERWKRRRTAERLCAAHRVPQYISFRITVHPSYPSAESQHCWLCAESQSCRLWFGLFLSFFFFFFCGGGVRKLNGCRNVVLFCEGLVQILETSKILYC